MIAAHIDALFDQGWLSFSNDGQVLISTELSDEVKKYLTLPKKYRHFLFYRIIILSGIENIY